MKKWLLIILLACMAIAIAPASAENEFYGNMEVVNCKEWVSLRESPSASARRLAKVPLGAAVADCVQYEDGWICAVYEGRQGYIQDKYLQLAEGFSVYSAMLVTLDTDVYAAINDTEPESMIRAGYIARNCAVMGSGRAYVECGFRIGYVEAEAVTPFGEVTQFPQVMTMRCDPFPGAYEGPARALFAADAGEYPLDAYAYTEYDYTPNQSADADTPVAAFVLHADTAVTNVHLYSVSLRYTDEETGEDVYDFILEHTVDLVDESHPLSVCAVVYGDMPNLAVGYEDWTGAYHFAFVEISGEDGSILLREF